MRDLTDLVARLLDMPAAEAERVVRTFCGWEGRGPVTEAMRSVLSGVRDVRVWQAAYRHVRAHAAFVRLAENVERVRAGELLDDDGARSLIASRAGRISKAQFVGAASKHGIRWAEVPWDERWWDPADVERLAELVAVDDVHDL